MDGMIADHDLERRLADAYAAEAPMRAPDRVLASILETVDHTRQRHVVLPVPRRLQSMNPYAKLAIAAVAVVAVSVVGLAIVRPGSGPTVGALPPASPSTAPSSSPSPTPRPTPTPLPTAAALTGTFTSTRNGLVIAAPAGWKAQAATQPWVSGETNFLDPQADFLYEPALQDHLFLVLKSQPLGTTKPAAWIDAVSEFAECSATQPVTVDGAPGMACPTNNFVAVTSGGRGYVIRLYTSGDEGWIDSVYTNAWFDRLLASVDLRPQDAIAASPSARSSARP
jgi:hypothetical protein